MAQTLHEHAEQQKRMGCFYIEHKMSTYRPFNAKTTQNMKELHKVSRTQWLHCRSTDPGGLKPVGCGLSHIAGTIRRGPLLQADDAC